MRPEIERRIVLAELRSEPEKDGKKKKLKGYAARFNVVSDDLGGFREVIMPGAFDRAIKEEHDVRALWNHNSDMVLGRTKSGTLSLSVDDEGLQIEIDPPDTQAGRDAMTVVERGDVDQMSFAFRTITDNWRTEEKEVIRELVDLELLDISPVAYPAYPQTSISARALDQAKAAAPAQDEARMSLNRLRQRWNCS